MAAFSLLVLTLDVEKADMVTILVLILEHFRYTCFFCQIKFNSAINLIIPRFSVIVEEELSMDRFIQA